MKPYAGFLPGCLQGSRATILSQRPKMGRSRLGRKNNRIPMASCDLKISRYTGARLDTDVYLQLCDLGEVLGL